MIPGSARRPHLPDCKSFRLRPPDPSAHETGIESILTPAHKHEVIFELLGGSPSDILLPANFLIVEDSSEAQFLKRVIERHYPDKGEIQILPANGDDDRTREIVTAVENLIATLERRPIYRERLTILFDKPDGDDKQRRFDAFRQSRRHPNADAQLFVLPVLGLEDSRKPIGPTRSSRKTSASTSARPLSRPSSISRIRLSG